MKKKFNRKNSVLCIEYWLYRGLSEKEAKKEISKIQSSRYKKSLENGRINGMAGKSHYSIWLEKYGKEEADKRYEDWTKKNSLSTKKRMNNISKEDQDKINQKISRNTREAMKKKEVKEKMNKGIRKRWDNITEEELKSIVDNHRKKMEENGHWVKKDDLNNKDNYYREVDKITRRCIKKLFKSWNGIDNYTGLYIGDNFSLHYNDDNYPTIDHRIPKIYGFKNNIDPKIIGSINNLSITTRINNLKKSSEIHSTEYFYTNVDRKTPHKAFIGRYFPLHMGHTWIMEENRKDEPLLIMIRDTSFDELPVVLRAELVVQWILTKKLKASVIVIPDIKGIYYGRDVGYEVEEMIPPEKLKVISATKIREMIRDKDDSWKSLVADGTQGLLENIYK